MKRDVHEMCNKVRETGREGRPRAEYIVDGAIGYRSLCIFGVRLWGRYGADTGQIRSRYRSRLERIPSTMQTVAREVPAISQASAPAPNKSTATLAPVKLVSLRDKLG
jgi:hypothetical protein